MSALTDGSVLRHGGCVLLAIVVLAGTADDSRFGAATADEAKLAVERVGHSGEVVTPTPQRGRRAPVPEDGLIAGFEDGAISASFGAGWQVNNDADAGGKSEAEVAAVDGGADGSSMSMRVTGRIVPGDGPAAWAGPVFFPGPQPYGPVSMAGHEGISFWIRGDGSPVSVVIFARSLPQAPATVSVPTTETWIEHRLAFADFDGLGILALTAIMFSGIEPGDFEFQVDELRVW